MGKVEGNTQTKNCRIITTIVAVLLIFPAFLWASQFFVIQVSDGDTIKVDKDGTKLVIRLVGIDAPELSKKKYEQGQPFSQKAKRHLVRLVYNKTVDIKSYGQDRYGRTLAVVILYGTTDANLEMVKAGLAEVYRGRPLKGHDLSPYWTAEAEAKSAKRGMWVLGDKYISPREWRKGRRN